MPPNRCSMRRLLLRICAVSCLANVVFFALMLLMPYAPLEPGAAPLHWLPAKCRKFVEFTRAKLGVERTGDLPA